jgi:hypothetical protein
VTQATCLEVLTAVTKCYRASPGVSGTRMLKHEGCLHLSPITSKLVR